MVLYEGVRVRSSTFKSAANAEFLAHVMSKKCGTCADASLMSSTTCLATATTIDYGIEASGRLAAAHSDEQQRNASSQSPDALSLRNVKIDKFHSLDGRDEQSRR